MIDRPEQGLFSKWCPSPVKRRRPGAWVFDPLSEQEEWEDYYEQLDDDLVEYEIKQLLGERRQRRKADMGDEIGDFLP